ncbi:LysR family transcriptional regulator [Variovorax soli]|uniref:LysR substrate-binding domain-containing protein n=1 Tax=Variovorax soli TaxID=376815 RepID=UPI0008389B76|nr:LysR family transcriptional regulator [Variovorax soli]
MDLRRWTHVVAVADRRSFVRAAEQVHLSQPALTRSIQAAEAELGLLLFDRKGSEVVPTPAGEFVVERARQLVFNSHCLERDVALYRSHRLGDTAFGVGPFPAVTFLPGLLADLRREHPGINLRVEVSNWQLLLKRLREEDIEFYVADTTELPADPSLQSRPLKRQPGGFYVRAGHPLADTGPVSLPEAWRYGALAIRVPVGVRSVIARMLGLPSADELKVALECDDANLLTRVTLESDSVLVAAHAAVAGEVAAGRLKLLEIRDLPLLQAQAGVVTLRGRTPSRMAELIISRLPLLNE